MLTKNRKLYDELVEMVEREAREGNMNAQVTFHKRTDY